MHNRQYRKLMSTKLLPDVAKLTRARFLKAGHG